MPGDPYAAAPPAEPFAASMQRDPGRLRIGLMRRAPRELEIDAECGAAMDHTVALLEGLGHRVEESHPDALEDPGCVAHYVRVVTANTARALEVAATKVGHSLAADEVEPLTWALAEQGRGHSATQLLETLEFVHGFGRRVAAWYADFDLLLTPTQGAKPARIGYLTSTREEPLRAFLRAAPYGVFTLPFNLTGQPGISLPLHWTDEGLPLGSQFVAATGREDLLFQLAAQLEAEAPWAGRRPPVFADA
jgi:amidase